MEKRGLRYELFILQCYCSLNVRFRRIPANYVVKRQNVEVLAYRHGRVAGASILFILLFAMLI